MRPLATLLSFILLSTLFSPVQAENIAITGGTLHTMGAAGIVDNGIVLIEDGKISAVGQNLVIPDGFDIIDAHGKWVTPGLMNSATRLGLQEVMMVGTTSDHNAQKAPFSAAFDVSYGLNPQSTAIPITRMEGVTRALVLPSTFNFGPAGMNNSLFGGLGALVHLGLGTDMLVRPKAVMYAELGALGASKAGGARGAAWVSLLNTLSEVDNYQANQAAYATGWRQDAYTKRLDIEALIPVLDGQIPLLVRAENAADIRRVTKLQGLYPSLRIILLGGKEAWMAADDLARTGIPVVLNPLHNLPDFFESLAATSYNAARLSEAGILFAIAGGSSGMVEVENARLITQTAGNAVAYGLPWQAALEAITINPAKIFGLDDHYGTLESGMTADVVVWDGDPLEVMTNADAVIINGAKIPLTSRQTKLRDRYQDLSDTTTPFMYR